MQEIKLSIVSTIYFSEPFLREFCSRIVATAEKITDDFEIILVDDGSPDNSLKVALDIQESEQRIQIVELSRNFGHHPAIVAGLEFAKGDLVYLTDCDLEEQPEWLEIFMNQMKSSDVDVVYGVQKKRVADYISNYFGGMFWKAINVMSKVRIPHNPMTCRLMNRRYLDALLKVEDRVLYLAGVFAWSGFKQKGIALLKQRRSTIKGSNSTYNLSRKLLQVVDSFSSFSIAPLYFIFIVGVITWLLSVLYGVFILISRVLYPASIQLGFTSLMLSIWFFSGTIIITLSIVGLYVANIFQEVKRRPLYIVRNYHQSSKDA